jgi:hypothetical protein
LETRKGVKSMKIKTKVRGGLTSIVAGDGGGGGRSRCC